MGGNIAAGKHALRYVLRELSVRGVGRIATSFGTQCDAPHAREWMATYVLITIK